MSFVRNCTYRKKNKFFMSIWERLVHTPVIVVKENLTLFIDLSISHFTVTWYKTNINTHVCCHFSLSFSHTFSITRPYHGYEIWEKILLSDRMDFIATVLHGTTTKKVFFFIFVQCCDVVEEKKNCLFTCLRHISALSLSLSVSKLCWTLCQ